MRSLRQCLWPIVASLIAAGWLTACAPREVPVTVVVSQVVVVTSTERPVDTPTPTDRPTETPLPTSTQTLIPTATPTPTQLPLPSNGSIYRPNIALGSSILLWISIGLFAAWIMVVLRHAFTTADGKLLLPSLIKETDRLSLSLGVAFIFSVIGLSSIFLIQNWLVASLLLVAAWLIPSGRLYPGLVILSAENWFARNLFYILFGVLYLLAWIGFAIVATTGSVSGTIVIYVVGLVLYFIVRRPLPGIGTAFRSRARDDLFLLILVLFTFMALMYATAYYEAATLAGTVIDEMYWKIYGWGLASPWRDMIQSGRDVFYAVYSTLANASVVEVYGYGATLLIWTLRGQRKEDSQLNNPGDARFAGKYFMVVLCVLSTLTVLYCIARFVVDYDPLLGLVNLYIGLVYGIPSAIAGIVLFQASSQLESIRATTISDPSRLLK